MSVLFLIVTLLAATHGAQAQTKPDCTNTTVILSPVIQEFASTKVESAIVVPDFEIDYRLLWVLPISIKLSGGSLTDMKTVLPAGDIWLCNYKDSKGTSDFTTILSNFTFTKLTVKYANAKASFLFFSSEGSLTVQVKNNKFEFSGSCQEYANKTVEGDLNFLAVRESNGLNIDFDTKGWFKWPITSLVDHVLLNTDKLLTGFYSQLEQVFRNLSDFVCQALAPTNVSVP